MYVMAQLIIERPTTNQDKRTNCLKEPIKKIDHVRMPAEHDLRAHIRLFIPIVMCGVAAIYGLVIDVILTAQSMLWGFFCLFVF